MWKVVDSCKYRLSRSEDVHGKSYCCLSVSTSAYLRKPNNIETLFCLDPPFTKLLKPDFIDVFIQGRLRVKHIEISVITQQRNGVAAMNRTHGCHNNITILNPLILKNGIKE